MAVPVSEQVQRSSADSVICQGPSGVTTAPSHASQAHDPCPMPAASSQLPDAVQMPCASTPSTDGVPSSVHVTSPCPASMHVESAGLPDPTPCTVAETVPAQPMHADVSPKTPGVVESWSSHPLPVVSAQVIVRAWLAMAFPAISAGSSKVMEPETASTPSVTVSPSEVVYPVAKMPSV